MAVPFRRRKELLEWSHDKNGHMGITKTYDRLRERFWWAQLYADVTDWITTCDHCQAKKGHPTNVGQLQPMVVDQPWKRIGMDLMGPLPKTEEGFRHILVIVDYFSKWVEAFALKTKSSREIMDNLVGKVISRFGIPEEILTDRALEFNQGIAKEIYRELGIKKLSTTAYHPQTDGLVERYNATIKAILAKLVDKHKKDWNKWIPTAMFVLRTTKQASTGQTPHFILFGREANDPAYLNYPGENSRRMISLDQRIRVHREVKDALTKVAARSKERYDRVHTISDFREGDWVLLYDKIPPSKFGKVWVGPFIIREVKGPLTVELEDSPKASLGRRHRIVNVSRIKAYKGRTLYEDVPRAHRQNQDEEAGS